MTTVLGLLGGHHSVRVRAPGWPAMGAGERRKAERGHGREGVCKPHREGHKREERDAEWLTQEVY